MSPDRSSTPRRVVILTGSELRHTYVRKIIAADEGIEVVATYCEGVEQGLRARLEKRDHLEWIERAHIDARDQVERDFFEDYVASAEDFSRPRYLAKGAINDPEIVDEIKTLNPDLLVCYGSSLIKSDLVETFAGRFLNVHLGLSPYYRGSGTNVWALINGEPGMVGATFMHIDAGIDTGAIIHQIRARLVVGDSPHTIGTRLIKDMALAYAQLIRNFDDLASMEQPEGEGRLYLRKDFTSEACAALYARFGDGLVQRHLRSTGEELVDLVSNPGMEAGA